jgi:hypothetical protein
MSGWCRGPGLTDKVHANRAAPGGVRDSLGRATALLPPQKMAELNSDEPLQERQARGPWTLCRDPGAPGSERNAPQSGSYGFNGQLPLGSPSTASQS